jgi:hypothetical protein
MKGNQQLRAGGDIHLRLEETTLSVIRAEEEYAVCKKELDRRGEILRAAKDARADAVGQLFEAMKENH